MRARAATALLVSSVAAAGPSRPPAPVVWAAWTSSPRAIGLGTDAARDDREAQLLARCGRGEEGLREAASQIARARSSGAARLDVDALTFALRAAGEPHVWPRAWVATGRALDHEATLAKLEAWTASYPDVGERRCGVTSLKSEGGDEVIAAVALDALADLEPLPTRAHVGMFLTVDARVLVPVAGTHVVVQGPGEEPRALSTWAELVGGAVHVRARFAPDRPGAFTVQIVGDAGNGPRPLLEARVFADVAPPDRFQERAAPGEDAPAGPTAAESLASMVDSLRDAGGLPRLARDARLDALAAAHARRMIAARAVGHDVGDGDPTDRMGRAGAHARVVGENVAHAASLRLAHRALYDSPSHRANLLRAEFDRLGVAVVDDADGSVWVAELFAAGLR